jgi:hypothetical protein
VCARGKQPASCQGQAQHSDHTWMNKLGESFPDFCVHAGCRYYYLDPTVNKGWDVAALSDAVSDYQGSCGRCYEIGCAPMHLKVRFAQLRICQVQKCCAASVRHPAYMTCQMNAELLAVVASPLPAPAASCHHQLGLQPRKRAGSGQCSSLLHAACRMGMGLGSTVPTCAMTLPRLSSS